MRLGGEIEPGYSQLRTKQGARSAPWYYYLQKFPAIDSCHSKRIDSEENNINWVSGKLRCFDLRHIQGRESQAARIENDSERSIAKKSLKQKYKNENYIIIIEG